MLSQFYSHRKFILTPLLAQLKAVVASASTIGNGIEFTAIDDYILHSLFLQMTGAQEQKIKCIVWDIANSDMQYRYDKYELGKVGECSNIDDKNKVYGEIISKIHELAPTYKMFVDANAKRTFLDKISTSVCSVFSESNFIHTHSSAYNVFKNIWANLKGNNIDGGQQMIMCAKKNTPNETLSDNEQLFGIYQLLYRHRNRSAHNLLSYQDNLPPLWEMRDVYIQEHYNIFIFIAVLILIDEMLMKAFAEYVRLQKLVL